jgi:acyl-CoA thioester hydrolase
MTTPTPPNPSQNTGIGPSKTWTCTLHARGYELDGFGHVNHAVYISYLEHARWELLKEEGVTLKHFQTWKKWPVIAALEARYLKPVFLDDPLTIHTRLTGWTRSKFTFEQEIRRSSDKVFTARVHAVMVNEEGRPTAIPDELTQGWIALGGATGTPEGGQP